MDFDTIYEPDCYDDVPYTCDRPVTLQDSTGRTREGYLSKSHENMIRTLLSIGWTCVVRKDDDSGWVAVEYVP